jgi:hypothetical protein
MCPMYYGNEYPYLKRHNSKIKHVRALQQAGAHIPSPDLSLSRALLKKIPFLG